MNISWIHVVSYIHTIIMFRDETCNAALKLSQKVPSALNIPNEQHKSGKKHCLGTKLDSSLPQPSKKKTKTFINEIWQETLFRC